jgi:hypothetical protein
MAKCLVAFMCGAATITACVVASGLQAWALVLLGAAMATMLYGVIGFAIGARRLGRSIEWISRRRTHRASRTARGVRNIVRRSPVEEDVVSALVHQGVARRVALKATLDAASEAPQEFEPLFKAALDFMHKARPLAESSATR